VNAYGRKKKDKWRIDRKMLKYVEKGKSGELTVKG
jgi:hypothetical protein